MSASTSCGVRYSRLRRVALGAFRGGPACGMGLSSEETFPKTEHRLCGHALDTGCNGVWSSARRRPKRGVFGQVSIRETIPQLKPQLAVVRPYPVQRSRTD